MKKVLKMPIGLGMNHLEQEISACHVWNNHFANGTNPADWVEITERHIHSDLFSRNIETGLNLEMAGFIEVSDDLKKFRLTQKAIDLIADFAEKQ